MTNGWDRNIERLLGNWSQQVTINETEYRKQANNFKKWHYAFGAFGIITQTGALTTLLNAIATGNATGPMLIIVAVLESLILVADGLNAFFNFGGGSEKYYEAAKDHGALSRFIDSTLSLPRAQRGEAREVVLSIRDQFNDLVKDNTIQLPPNKVIHKLEMCIYEDPKQAIGNYSTRGSGLGILFNDIESGNSTPTLKSSTADIEIIIDKTRMSKKSSGSNSSVNLPGLVDPDAEQIISHKQRCNTRQQILNQKTKVQKEDIKNKGFMSKTLEYQWDRMLSHEEE